MAKKKKAKAKFTDSFVNNSDYKTKAPSGMTVTRKGLAFTIKWKIEDKDYGGGQQVQWALNGSNSWTSVANVQTTDTTKVVTLSASSYYPTTTKTINLITFRVRGLIKKASVTTKTYKPNNILWSDWQTCKFVIAKPANPTVSAAWGGSGNPYTTSFTATGKSSDSDGKPYASMKWESVLVKDCSVTDGSKVSWKTTALGYQTGTFTDASKTIAIQESSGTIVGAGKSHTRWFRACARGIGGATAYYYAKHVYATPNAAQVQTVKYTTENSVPVIQVGWKSTSNSAHPVDKTEVQWLIDTPLAGMTCPSGTWTTATTPKDTGSTDSTRFSIETTIGLDECLWTRVKMTHDENVSYSSPTLVKKGKLSDPDDLVVSVNQTTFRATVEASNNSDVPDANLAVVFRQSKNPSKDLIVGIIPNGSTSVTVQAPNWTNMGAVSFGVYAFQGTYANKTVGSGGVNQYTVNANMKSDTVWDGGAVPIAPTSVTATQSATAGEIVVTWKWAWTDATVTEISWSQNENAWESTEEPEAYVVTNLYNAKWRISNLETGVIWYVRVRLGKGSGDDITYGPYCDAVPVNLTSAPAVPELVLSEGIITKDGTVTASWVYVTNDGTPQGGAEICQATISGSTITYGTIIAHTQTAQKIVISARDAGWQTGNTYNLCVRVTSGSGKRSDGWSDPVPITIADPAACSIESTSLQNVTITDDTSITRTVLSLTAMPLTVTVDGAGDDGITTVAVERAQDYSITRPDDTIFHGYEGETIALVSRRGEGSVTIGLTDLIGVFDDEAHYRIVATVQDELGQSATDTLDFEVHWSHQAIVPKASVVIDENSYIAVITPIAPTGVGQGDTYEIYRLSADKPELIVQGAAWGTAYVDPYPTVGSFGGHRVVLRTVDGDSITASNQMAWIDLGEEDSDILDVESTIIDFPGGQAILDYNIRLSNSWKKDFQETQYLGGTIQGDWNPAVSRATKVDGIVIIEDDPTQIQVFRKLATYAGICHVRTPEGSSFAADVQVTETASYEDGGQTASFSLSITRVDPEGLDGVPWSDWYTEEA